MRRVLPIVLLVLLASSIVAAKDWRGILPMHSTREDVIAILGPPLQPPEGRAYTLHSGRSIYFLDEAEVYIAFADEDFLKEKNCRGVPSGTVLMIQITPRDLSLSSLNLDEKRFRKFDPSKPPGIGYEAFIDNDEGLVIRAFEGKVDTMIYFASAADRVRCPEYFENPETAVQIMRCGLVPKFDEYGDNIRWSDEKARLDNFAIQLMNFEKAHGLIVVYAGRKATVAEAQIRANRARDYLINIRKIDPGLVKAIDAGHRENLTVSLYIWPTDIDPPPFEGTIPPSEVEIIYQKEKRTQRKRP